MAKLIIVDLDGTLFDTKDVNYHAYRDAPHFTAMISIMIIIVNFVMVAITWIFYRRLQLLMKLF